ncbi:hypothetical protein AXF42_Ash011472 [Apostasia shenzhenica]|uniref:GTD-binding domain-containing protein n=1 Tax=Apostasia shenzhenica TaxID=1088818 RepID=A0A2I0BAQ3_9ASPA|nr:hypothetical protein AXF42_Ash011472 [Apostasia shenzhenica]
MAANKFATLLHRNTRKMAFLLVYTALEWILIAFLLLNALFSYLIARFASFFGLKSPCVLCSRVDHLFEPGDGRSKYCDLLCESHAGEVSLLGFCSNHRRLTEVGDLCEDCSASRSAGADRTGAPISWMKRSEQGEMDLRCSCCGVVLESGFYSPYALVRAEDKSVDEVLAKEVDQKWSEEEGGSAKDDDDQKGETLLPSSYVVVEDASVEILALPVEIRADLDRPLPIELIDSFTMMKPRPRGDGCDDKHLEGDDGSTVGIIEISVRHSYAPLPTEEPLDDTSTDTGIELVAVRDAEELEKQKTIEDAKVNEEANCVISIGSEICDQEQIEPAQFNGTSPQQEFVTDQSSESFKATIDSVVCDQEQIKPAQINEPLLQHKFMAVQCPESLKETIDAEPEQSARRVKHLTISPVVNEIVDDRMPETPTTPSSIDPFPLLPRRFFLERRESGTESLDGSIASDIDTLEPLTIDRLKAALKSERKALNALYAELEEERNASAIAANQTMAMITRLQEEKATMQMEALQYQRMMEEQSEYDQEALQLLNELMLKKEKEKKDLEKELEECRQKVLVYEARERKKRLLNEKSDDLSDEPHECEERSFSHLNELDESLAEFEVERVSILEQVKTTEENIIRVKSGKSMWDENGHEINGDCELLKTSVNGSTDYFGTNGMLHRERNSGIRGKNLLPLFDAVSLENEKLCTKHDLDDHNKQDIVEEADQVYERLESFEADSELLKNCISSLKKGEKGLDLLREILQHLQDLRRLQFSERNTAIEFAL